MAVVKPLLTPDDVECMVERGELESELPFELVNGEIVWLTLTSSLHARICVLIILALGAFAKQIGGAVLSEGGGYRVAEGLRNLRAPDVSLVVKERLHILPNEGFALAGPDLAVEVLSRGQYGPAYAQGKVAEYFAAGTRLVWLVDPRKRNVRVHQVGSGEYVVYSMNDLINLDAIAPGFSCRVAEFFPN